MSAYKVIVTREDGLWVAIVHGLPAHHVGATDVDHFADLDVEVRDLVAGLLDLDPAGFDLDWHYEVGGVDVTDVLRRFMAAEEELRRVMSVESIAAAARDEARREAIERMRRGGLSQSAIGDAIGLSKQRVSQLINS